MRAGSPRNRRIEAGRLMPTPPPRPRVELNRTDAGAELLGQIEGWSGDERWIESQLGNLLFRHPGYVPLLRKRLTVTIEKERLVKGFMAAFPDPRLAFINQKPEINAWLHNHGIYR